MAKRPKLKPADEGVAGGCRPANIEVIGFGNVARIAVAHPAKADRVLACEFIGHGSYLQQMVEKGPVALVALSIRLVLGSSRPTHMPSVDATFDAAPMGSLMPRRRPRAMLLLTDHYVSPLLVKAGVAFAPEPKGPDQTVIAVPRQGDVREERHWHAIRCPSPYLGDQIAQSNHALPMKAAKPACIQWPIAPGNHASAGPKAIRRSAAQRITMIAHPFVMLEAQAATGGWPATIENRTN